MKPSLSDVPLRCSRECLASATMECWRFRAFGFAERGSWIRDGARRQSLRPCTKWVRPVPARTWRRQRRKTTKRWRWTSDTSASRDGKHWRRRWEHRRTGKPMKRWLQQTRRWSEAIHSAARTWADSGRPHRPLFPKRRRCRWTRVSQKFARPSTIQAADIREWRSIPGEIEMPQLNVCDLLGGNLRGWRCCDSRWIVSGTDNMGTWSLWSNTPTAPCSWSCWRIHRSFRSNTASRTTSTRTPHQCRRSRHRRRASLKRNTMSVMNGVCHSTVRRFVFDICRWIWIIRSFTTLTWCLRVLVLLDLLRHFEIFSIETEQNKENIAEKK